MQRHGDWIQTASGGKLYPLDPVPEEIRLEDIAHALAHINRYTGHAQVGFSVAQHSVLVAQLVPDRWRLAALLHDAAEYGLGDVSRPVKRDTYFQVGGNYIHFSVVEYRLLRVIFTALGVPRPDAEGWRQIELADNILLASEARQFLAPLQQEWHKWIDGVTPLPEPLEPWPAARAKREFLRQYEELKQ